MDSHAVSLWLEDKRCRNYGAVKEHTNIYYALLTSTTSPLEAATQLNGVVAASKHKDAGWRCRQVLLAAVAEMPEFHEVLLEFTKAILELPLQAINTTFWWDWGDQQRYLWSRRQFKSQPGQDLSASRDISELDRNVNFVTFSVKLARVTNRASSVLATAFFDLRDALEGISPSKRGGNVHFSEQDLKWIDVEVAAQWVIHGREAVLDLKNEDIEGWERGLAGETELWHGAPGLSAGRWKLWYNELVTIAHGEVDQIPGRTKIAASEAADLIRTGLKF